MPDLDADTLYYRHDHPRGYLLAAGTPQPDPAEGWSPTAEGIQPAPAKTYECTTFDAYEGLLASERLANGFRAETLNKVSEYVGQLREQNAGLAEENSQLQAEVKRLNLALSTAAAARA